MFRCDQAATRSYTLIPLLTDSGTVVYRDRADQPEWRGSPAGDALYNTMQTLSAFSSLGRNGWNGLNGDANVVLDSTYDNPQNLPDYGFFRMTGSGDPRVPPTPFLGIARSENFYNMAAALDAIAHEWGHGVIFTSANFPCVTPDTLPCQLHEGFADVIAQIVEKKKQPTGAGLEQSSDWTIHEDNGRGGYVRGALDDGDGGHTWTDINGIPRGPYNQTVHRQDADGTDPQVPAITQSHMRGNMLNMVLRLLVEGGTNPICARHPEYGGCGTTVTGLGLTKGSQILFDTVQFYAPANAQWADLASYASAAAFDRYNRCLQTGYPATVEQDGVDKAFGAIGYPRLTPADGC